MLYNTQFEINCIMDHVLFLVWRCKHMLKSCAKMVSRLRKMGSKIAYVLTDSVDPGKIWYFIWVSFLANKRI